MRRMNWLRLAAGLLLLLWSPSMVHADLDDYFQRLKPYITVGEEYNSNINLTSTHRKDDFITTISPGLKISTLPKSAVTGQFRLPLTTEEDKYGIDMDYRLNLVYYAKNPDNDFVGYEGTLNGWYTVGRRLTFRLRTHGLRSEEPIEPDYSSSALPGQILPVSQKDRPIYLRNVLEPSVEYRFGREDLISLNYRGNFYSNQDPRYEDSQEHFINPRIAYWFDIRNGVSLEYALTLGNFERSPDLVGHMVSGRYTYRFNPRTSIFGEDAFLIRNFDSSPARDYNVQRPSLGIEYAFSSTLKGRAQGGWFWEDPKEGSKTSGPYYDVNLTQRAERTIYALSLQGGYTEEYFTAENLGFARYNRAIGAITHQLMERMTGELSSYFENVKYRDGRMDNLWGVRGNISYNLLRWLSTSLELSYREDHSNRDLNDYNEFRAIFRVTAAY